MKIFPIACVTGSVIFGKKGQRSRSPGRITWRFHAKRWTVPVRSTGRGFDSQWPYCQAATLGKSDTRVHGACEVTTVHGAVEFD